jgi:hypothetical protein
MEAVGRAGVVENVAVRRSHVGDEAEWMSSHATMGG